MGVDNARVLLVEDDRDLVDFLQHMLESEKDHAIVKAVIDLAHNFNLKVVAEGVQTQAIADRLAEMRCDILQGYVFDRPLPVGHHFFLNLRLDGRVCLVDYAVRNCFPTVDGGHRVGAEFCQVVGREADPDLDGLLSALLDAAPDAVATAQ